MVTTEQDKLARIALSDALFARMPDPKALAQLCELHHNLARKYAHAYASESPERYEDLEQIAVIGLLRAIREQSPVCRPLGSRLRPVRTKQ